MYKGVNFHRYEVTRKKSVGTRYHPYHPTLKMKKKENDGAFFEKFDLETIFGDVLANISKLRFFSENQSLSLFSPYSALTSYKESEKSLEPF